MAKRKKVDPIIDSTVICPLKLHIELVPKTCWGSNVRTRVKKSDWDKIRKSVYAKEKMRCHICETECGSSPQIHAHEIWEFDEENHIQRLADIIGVCAPCHNTIHYGRAQKIGYEKEAREQFFKVNEFAGPMDLQIELLRVQDDYFRRSEIEDWKLDLSFLEKQGYVVNKDK